MGYIGEERLRQFWQKIKERFQPVGDYEAAGSAEQALLAAKSYTDQVIQGVDVVAPSLSFLYQCTGTDDNLTIQNIINDFLLNGTAKTMKMIITGTMGLQNVPAEGRYIALTSSNSRGANIYLDFENCNIPELTTYKTFLYVGYIANSNIYINGININSSFIGASVIFSASNIFLHNCKIAIASGVAIEKIMSGTIVVIDGCVIESSGDKTISIATSRGIINNCNISVSVKSGDGYCIYNSFGDIAITNCIIIASTSSSSGNIYAVQNYSGNLKMDNCTINGSGGGNAIYGVINGSGAASFAQLSNCTIKISSTGNTVAISQAGTKMVVDNCIIEAAGSAGNSQGVFCSFVASYLSLNNCIISSTTTGTTGTVYGVNYANGEADLNINNCDISTSTSSSGAVYGIYVEGISAANGIKVTGSRIIGKYGIYIYNAATAGEVKLTDNAIKGTGSYDIYQLSGSNTIKWHLAGNTFSKANVMLDGTTAISYKTASSYIYFPQYANKFSAIIS